MASYKKTINLPKTKYPQRAGLQKLEPAVLERWESEGMYERIRAARQGSPRYVLHDGPPYASGKLHIGTGMNKILKDVVVKYKTMQGYDAPYIPGWDCHGLPIERKVLDELGPAAKETPTAAIRARCHAFALSHIEGHRQQFKALGIFGRWQDPYLTLNPRYEAGVIDVFGRLVEGGFVERQLKPIHWCMTCTTALAEAELEYADKKSPGITVRFDLVDDVNDVLPGEGPVGLAIWTTTPWTLVANQGIAVHPEATYARVKGEAGTPDFVIALDLKASLEDLLGTGLEVVSTCTGKSLEGRRYQHAWLERTSPVVLAGYVGGEGTGLVHTAPGHGQDDYHTGLKNGLPITSPVDDEGIYADEAGDLAGLHVFKANATVVERLRQSGHLLHHNTITHSYAHCWRCRKPIIFRATEQWFVRVDHRNLRERALVAIRDEVQWVPEWGQGRIEGMVEGRPDWCVSRQRAWGIPIPACYCNDCGQVVLDKALVDAVRDHFRVHGANSWFTSEPQAILGDQAVCRACGSTSLRKEEDIFDVWFESGASWRSVVEEEPELSYPADLYLEGTDQHRGWFQLSLLPALAATDTPPFRTVLTHGFVVDEEGEKMAKSRGNYISLEDGLKEFSGDLLRLWFTSVDYMNDIRVSRKLMKQTGDAYRKIRNTLRFLLGNLADFDPLVHGVHGAHQLMEVDRWLLAGLEQLIQDVKAAYEEFRFHRVYRLLHNFCTQELSSLYLDITRDRLYTWSKDDPRRRGAQRVCYRATDVLIRLMAPILVFSAEEAWGYLPAASPDRPESVHLALFPESEPELRDDALLARWERVLSVRGAVLQHLERARHEKVIGKALEARVVLASEDPALATFLADVGPEEWARILIVTEVELQAATGPDFAPCDEEPTLGVQVVPLGDARSKCVRCWHYRASVGQLEDHPDLCQPCAGVVRELDQPA